jgi:hypothetical protein
MVGWYVINELERYKRTWLWPSLGYLPSIWLDTSKLCWQSHHSFLLCYNNCILSLMTYIHKIWMAISAFHGMKVIAIQNVITRRFAGTDKHFKGTCCLHFRVVCCDTEMAYSFKKFVHRWSSLSWVNCNQGKHYFKWIPYKQGISAYKK